MDFKKKNLVGALFMSSSSFFPQWVSTVQKSTWNHILGEIFSVCNGIDTHAFFPNFLTVVLFLRAYNPSTCGNSYLPHPILHTLNEGRVFREPQLGERECALIGPTGLDSFKDLNEICLEWKRGKCPCMVSDPVYTLSSLLIYWVFRGLVQVTDILLVAKLTTVSGHFRY